MPPPQIAQPTYSDSINPMRSLKTPTSVWSQYLGKRQSQMTRQQVGQWSVVTLASAHVGRKFKQKLEVCFCHKAVYTVTLSKGRWCLAVVKVTVGLEETGSLPRSFWLSCTRPAPTLAWTFCIIIFQLRCNYYSRLKLVIHAHKVGGRHTAPVMSVSQSVCPMSICPDQVIISITSYCYFVTVDH